MSAKKEKIASDCGTWRRRSATRPPAESPPRR
jgi:hypothetical protein